MASAQEAMTGNQPGPRVWTTVIGWIRRLAIIYFLMAVCSIVFLVWRLSSAPTPLDVTSLSNCHELAEETRVLIEDLNRKPALRTFFDYDYSFMQFLSESCDEHQGNSQEIIQLSDQIIARYHDHFDDYRFSCKYLLASAIAAAFCALVVIGVPRVWNAVLLGIVSLAGTAVNSELLAGRDLSHLFWYTAPFLPLAIAIVGLAVVAYWAKKFETDPTSQDGWMLVGLGLLGIVLGLAWSTWEILSDTRMSYKTSQGLGATIATGLWSLVAGVRSLRQNRASQ